MTENKNWVVDSETLFDLSLEANNWFFPIQKGFFGKTAFPGTTLSLTDPFVCGILLESLAAKCFARGISFRLSSPLRPYTLWTLRFESPSYEYSIQEDILGKALIKALKYMYAASEAAHG